MYIRMSRLQWGRFLADDEVNARELMHGQMRQWGYATAGALGILAMVETFILHVNRFPVVFAMMLAFGWIWITFPKQKKSAPSMNGKTSVLPKADSLHVELEVLKIKSAFVSIAFISAAFTLGSIEGDRPFNLHYSGIVALGIFVLAAANLAATSVWRTKFRHDLEALND